MQILAARKYPTPRNDPLSLEETESFGAGLVFADAAPRRVQIQANIL